MNNMEVFTMRWIPLEEQRPAPFTTVLILYPRLYADQRDTRQSTFVSRLERSFGWMDGDGEWLCAYPKAEALVHSPPKYWMPLPPFDVEEFIPENSKHFNFFNNNKKNKKNETTRKRKKALSSQNGVL